MTLRQKHREIYWCWKAIKQRCLNPKCRMYRNYGGRGIGVCEEWLEFEPFCYWALENGYKNGLDLDRRENDGDYCPENCRWISRRKNVNNRRKTIRLTVDGITRPRTEWADACGVPAGTIKAWVSVHGKQYAEERIAEALRNGYIPEDYTRNHKRTRILCVETGIEYESFYVAAIATGQNRGNLVRAAKKNGTAGGYHYKIVEKQE